MSTGPQRDAMCPGCSEPTRAALTAAGDGLRIAAVSLDLDDTLYAQKQWLDGAWRTVARAADEQLGLPREDLHQALQKESDRGSDRGGIIDRALQEVVPGSPEDATEYVAPLVEAFRAHRATALTLYPGVRATLTAVRRAGLATAVVTDGHPPQQYDKLVVLDLLHLVDAVVVSDELGGRQFRKPAPEPFLKAARRLGIEPGAMLHLGDRPEKDLAGARAARLLGAFRVRTGEYRDRPCGTPGLGCFPDTATALSHLLWMTPRPWLLP